MSMLQNWSRSSSASTPHKHTHTAAVLNARTGAVLTRVTVGANGDGYEAMTALAAARRVRAWAMEGSGGYGAGLARHLAAAGELVIELDRPLRPARRAGAKSDPIDADRAARDALARTGLAQPKTGAGRAALQMRLTARRAAVQAAADAQRQLQAPVITAPRPSAPGSAVTPPRHAHHRHPATTRHRGAASVGHCRPRVPRRRRPALGNGNA